MSNDQNGENGPSGNPDSTTPLDDESLGALAGDVAADAEETPAAGTAGAAGGAAGADRVEDAEDGDVDPAAAAKAQARAELEAEKAGLEARIAELGDPIQERRDRVAQMQAIEKDLAEITESLKKEIGVLQSEANRLLDGEQRRAGEIERAKSRIAAIDAAIESVGA